MGRPTNGLAGLSGIKILHPWTSHFHLLLACQAAGYRLIATCNEGPTSLLRASLLGCQSCWKALGSYAAGNSSTLRGAASRGRDTVI